MKRVFCLLIFLASLSCGAQTRESLFSFSFDKIPFEKFVTEVEAGSEYKFFYVKSWVDTLEVSVEIKEAKIQDVLQQSLKGTKIQFYIAGDRIILTNNVPIIESKITRMARIHAGCELFICAGRSPGRINRETGGCRSIDWH